jgi:hypothetical protein
MVTIQDRQVVDKDGWQKALQEYKSRCKGQTSSKSCAIEPDALSFLNLLLPDSLLNPSLLRSLFIVILDIPPFRRCEQRLTFAQTGRR